MNTKLIFEPSETTHWKNLFPDKMKLLGSQNLNEGEELVATIKYISIEKIVNFQGKEENLPVVRFENAPPMILNITNSKTIASLYGESYKSWCGKSIQLYATKVKLKKEMVDALRIRPIIPDCSINVEKERKMLVECKTLKDLQDVFMSFNPYTKKALSELKDKLKVELK